MSNIARFFLRPLLCGALSLSPLLSSALANNDDFVPDPNKRYHIDNPAHGLRLAAFEDSEELIGVKSKFSGDNTQWKFTQSATPGLWHIDRAAGGSTPRIRTDLSSSPDMQATGYSGDWTRFSIEANPNRPGTYLLTTPLANTENQRLRLLGGGTTDFSTNNNVGKNPSFVFTEVESSTPPSTGKPNIVLIYADDLGYADISAYGSSVIDTPNLDSIGAQGFTALDYFTASNVCSPSRSSVLTGRYPMRNGVPVAVTPSSDKQIAAGFGLHTDEITIPEVLSDEGYRSVVIGKWHLGWIHEGSHPMDQGFDTNYGLKENYNANGDRDTLYRKRSVEIENVDPTALAELYTQRAEEFIAFNANRDQPFFMFLSHHIVHTPHAPSEDFVNSSLNGAYGDAIQELDHSTGRILQALDNAGIADNTLVIFTSDNGGWRRHNTSNGSFAGGKYNTMEGGHIVPAMFKWPGVIPAGLSSDATITSMDLMPLIARAAGASMPDDRVIDGRDITDIVTGRTNQSPHDVLYYYNGTNLQAVRKNGFKLHLPRTEADQPWWQRFSASNDTFDILASPQLFHLASDPGEAQNLINSFPNVASDLMSEAAAIRLELGDVDVIGSDQRVPPMSNPQSK